MSVLDDGCITINYTAHGITDAKTKELLMTEGPSLEIMRKHKLFNVSLYLLEQYLNRSPSQVSGKSPLSPIKFLTNTV